MKNNYLYIHSLGRTLNLDSIKVEGVDPSDAFDFCDAFISAAWWRDGYQLGKDEIAIVSENFDVQQAIAREAYEVFCGI